MENFEALVKQLKAEDPVDRDYAVEDLVELGDLNVINIIAGSLQEEASLQVRETMLSALRTLCAAVIDPIAPLLYSDNAQIRNGAVDILCEAGDSVIRLLDRLSQDANKDVRKFALDALKGKKSAAAIAILQNALEDECPNVRVTAVEYLGHVEDYSSAAKVLQALKLEALRGESNLMMIISGLEALSKMENLEISKEALQLYPEPQSISPMILFPYLKLLGKTGNAEHFPLLETLVSEQGSMFGRELIDAIEHICKREEIEELPESLSACLIQLAENVESPALKYEINHFLQKTSEDDSRLETARANLTSDQTMLKMAALETLAEAGTQEDLELLEEMAEEEEDDDVLEMLGEAMAGIGERD